MNEPQELRSVDELFRNTFNNLPDTPAESGWDIPSDHVWQQVKHQIAAPQKGPGLKTALAIGSVTMIVAFALIMMFRPDKKAPEKAPTPPIAPETIAATPAPEPAVAVPAAPVPVQENIARPAKKSSAQVIKRNSTRTEAPLTVNHEGDILRAGGAAPLPGTRSAKLPAPNTTEQEKAMRDRELELLWRTPVKLLPVPRNLRSNN